MLGHIRSPMNENHPVKFTLDQLNYQKWHTTETSCHVGDIMYASWSIAGRRNVNIELN